MLYNSSSSFLMFLTNKKVFVLGNLFQTNQIFVSKAYIPLGTPLGKALTLFSDKEKGFIRLTPGIIVIKQVVAFKFK